jgi:4-amino-4-deoxy-L-arabinose transferase-like glycosyltransferase
VTGASGPAFGSLREPRAVVDRVAQMARAPGARAAIARRAPTGPFMLFLLVSAATFAFGVWMASRGFRWGDAMSRAGSALAIIHDADAKLANIGFVWPPLPTLLNVLGALFYPIWPGIVSSGVSAALTTALCAGATAALLLLTARRLGLSNRLGWAFALLVATNPMIFLFASNGMAEGVAAPFLTGSVCCLTLFWHTGKRLWIAAAGTALALGVASVYQATAYAAAIYAALIGGILWSSEARAWAPQGRARAIEGLSLLLLVPPIFVGLLWIGANAVIMGDPLSFIFGQQGIKSFQPSPAEAAVFGSPPSVRADVVGALALLGERVWPFLIPLGFVLLARLVDGRLWRINSLSLVVLGLSVALGVVGPMAVSGAYMGFLRYHMYPLFAAAGWGLYEIAMSRRRNVATALILSGWLVAFPATVRTMASPRLGEQERGELMALVKGGNGDDPVGIRAPIARYLDAHVLGSGRDIVLDPDPDGGDRMVAMQIRPAYSDQLILAYHRRFKAAVADPASQKIGYFVMPTPNKAQPFGSISQTYPRLWSGQQPGFRLIKTLATPMEKWRIFAVASGARNATNTTGGGG